MRKVYEESNPDLTFNPKITARSRRLAQRKIAEEGGTFDVSKRLMETNNRWRRLEDAVGEAERECKFKPDISKHSKEIVSKKEAFRKASFLSRQKHFAEVRAGM